MNALRELSFWVGAVLGPGAGRKTRRSRPTRHAMKSSTVHMAKLASRLPRSYAEPPGGLKFEMGRPVLKMRGSEPHSRSAPRAGARRDANLLR
jgi:hypothetical protein